MSDHDAAGRAVTDDGPAPETTTDDTNGSEEMDVETEAFLHGEADAESGPTPPPDADGPESLTVEDLLDMIEQLTGERDGHFEARARLQAEFDNYRKRMASQQSEQAERAAESLVGKLLPVLDACDAARAHHVEGVEPLAAQLQGVLEREGLARLDSADAPFDPVMHEAVLHEPGDGAEPQVSEVLRSGYIWKGRVLRPAMVKVKG